MIGSWSCALVFELTTMTCGGHYLPVRVTSVLPLKVSAAVTLASMLRNADLQ